MQRAAMANGARCVGRCSTLRFWGQMNVRMTFVLSSGDAGEVLRLGKQHFEIPPPILSAKSTTFAESIRADALVQAVSLGKCAIGMTVPGQHITSIRL